MSPLCPPPGFPPHLAVIWPLIWAQILVLRVMVRAAYGKGTRYHWSVTPWGRAFIVSIDWVPGRMPVPAALTPLAHSNNRVAAALDGRAFTPAYARNSLVCAPPGESQDPAFARAVLAAVAPGLRRGERLCGNLPLPET